MEARNATMPTPHTPLHPHLGKVRERSGRDLGEIWGHPRRSGGIWDLGEIWDWERSGKELGEIWERSGRDLGEIWEISEGGFGKDLGDIWERSGGNLGEIWERSGEIWEGSRGSVIWERFRRNLGEIWRGSGEDLGRSREIWGDLITPT